MHSMRTFLRRILPPLFIVSVFLMTAPRSLRAAPASHSTGLGIGLMLGNPTGISLKQSLGGANAWDVGIGAGSGLRLHADYLWGLAQLLSDTSALTLDIYLGVGPVLGISRGWCGDAYNPGRGCGNRGAFAGVRVPFGLEARLTRAPVSFGLEIAPGIAVGQNFTDGLLDVFLFVRFWL
ncbi:MAG: DUF3996 domain-containing protein [Deltaproteobacteria bacterium]|nr:DUF3996 domain-containing protein [Deltaproteobacteria bacterium]